MRTIEDFYNEFENKDIEIVVFVTTGFGGAVPLDGSRQITSYFPAMIDLATNVLIEADGRIEQVVTNEAFSKKQYACFKDNGIYKLVVSKCLPKELSQNILPTINNRYLLKMVKSSYDVTNEPHELVAYREKYLKPVSLSVEDIEFLLNRRFKWYEGDLICDGNTCQVKLKLDSNSNAKADSAVLTFSSIKRDLGQWVLKAKEKANEELLSVALNCQDDSLELSSDDFKNCIRPLQSIIIKNDKSFEMYFGDSDIFGGHQIMMQGNIEDGFLGSDIVG